MSGPLIWLAFEKREFYSLETSSQLYTCSCLTNNSSSSGVFRSHELGASHERIHLRLSRIWSGLWSCDLRQSPPFQRGANQKQQPKSDLIRWAGLLGVPLSFLVACHAPHGSQYSYNPRQAQKAGDRRLQVAPSPHAWGKPMVRGAQ